MCNEGKVERGATGGLCTACSGEHERVCLTINKYRTRVPLCNWSYVYITANLQGHVMEKERTINKLPGFGLFQKVNRVSDAHN